MIFGQFPGGIIASAAGLTSTFPLVSDQSHKIDRWDFLTFLIEKNRAEQEEILSEQEKNVLYKVVSMECDTGYEGSLAVISCMLNRRDEERYPDALMDVVREKAQFTAYYDRSSKTYPYKDRVPSEECIRAVDDALEEGKRNIPPYVLYFRSSDYTSLEGYETYGTIGDNTYFYLEEDVE